MEARSFLKEDTAENIHITRGISVRYETDILIVRGGIAGTSAAAAAALCIAHKCDFRSLDHKEVQRVIVERGGVYDLDNYKINRNAGSS